MCLAQAWIRENGDGELVMEEVAHVKIENGRLILNSLFGEQKEIEAYIREIDFAHSRIVLGKARPAEVKS